MGSYKYGLQGSFTGSIRALQGFPKWRFMGSYMYKYKVVNRKTKLITYITGLKRPLINADEPPSKSAGS